MCGHGRAKGSSTQNGHLNARETRQPHSQGAPWDSLYGEVGEVGDFYDFWIFLDIYGWLMDFDGYFYLWLIAIVYGDLWILCMAICYCWIIVFYG